MRKLLLFLASALAAACGSGSKGGRSFAPVEVRAIAAGTGATPCSVELGGATASVGVKAVAIELTSYADACGDFASSQCRYHAGAQSVTILVAKLDPLGVEPELPPGTYTVTSSPTVVTPDGAGHLTVAYAQALVTDATCLGSPSPSVQGGTVRLDEVAGPVAGRASIAFQDGSSLERDFSAPICPGPGPDVCSLATAQALCTLPPLCVP